MLKILFMLFALKAYAFVPPYHCSPNPVDGTFYVNAPNVTYDNPIPKKCYSVMRKNGDVMDRRALVWKTDHFEEDAVLLKAANDADYAPDNAAAATKTRLSELRMKAKTNTLSPSEKDEALNLMLQK